MSAVREILAHFGVNFDTHNLKKGENQIEATIGQLKHLGHAVAGVFAFHQLEKLILGTVAAADELATSAVKLGVDSQELQKLRHAANMADVGVGSLQVGLRFLQRSMYESVTGSKELAEAFREAGVEVGTKDKLRSMTDVLLDLSDRMIAIDDPGKRTALAMRVLGRGGADMIPLLMAGRDKIKAYTEQVEEMGGAFDQEFMAVEDFVDQHEKKLGLLWTSLRVNVVKQLIPAFLAFGHQLESAGKWILRVNKNGELLRAGMVAFGAYAISQLPKVVAALRHINWQTTLLVAKFAILFLALDDLVAWFRGGKSVIGDFFDSFAPGVNAAAAEIGQFVAWVTKSWDNLGQALMMVPTMVGMAVTMAVNEIVHGVGWAIAWVFDQWDKLIRKLQLPGWATKLLGTDRVGDQSGGGNQKQLTEDWDQSRAKLGGMFDAAMQSGGWQGFEDFKKVAKAGGSWNMVTEQPQAMSAPVPPASLARPVEVHDSSTHNVTVNLPPTANAQTAHKTAAAVARENRNSNQAARFGLEHAVEG